MKSYFEEMFLWSISRKCGLIWRQHMKCFYEIEFPENLFHGNVSTKCHSELRKHFYTKFNKMKTFLYYIWSKLNSIKVNSNFARKHSNEILRRITFAVENSKSEVCMEYFGRLPTPDRRSERTPTAKPRKSYVIPQDNNGDKSRQWYVKYFPNIVTRHKEPEFA